MSLVKGTAGRLWQTGRRISSLSSHRIRRCRKLQAHLLADSLGRELSALRHYPCCMDDEALLERILAGDRDAFAELVQRYQTSLVRVARYYVKTEASAEDVAQDTWIAVMKGLERFEGRSSFKTWLFRIAANRARKTGTREYRVINLDPTDPVASARFNDQGMWIEPPAPFTELIDTRLANTEVLEACKQAIRNLPEPQQSVVTLRDVEGLSTSEVSHLLELSEANTRVLLHRGRAKIREALEGTLKGGYSWH